MGLMQRRERRVAAAAADHVSAGETVTAVAMVQTDGIAAPGSNRKQRSQARRFTVHAVVTTDAAVYVFAVGGLAKIEATVARTPLPEADVSLDEITLRVDGREFHVLPFGVKGAQALMQRVTDARVAE